METPEKPPLECFSSINSSSNLNLSHLLFAHESSESFQSHEEGFSCSILQNLKEDNSKPASRLINITQIVPGQNPRKLLLPLFYQDHYEEESYLPKSRRSFSMDSKKSSFTLQAPQEPRKMTTTTINTQSNTDLAESNPEFLREKEKFGFEQALKEGKKENIEFGANPCIFNCCMCGFSGISVVRRTRGNDGWAMKGLGKLVCCWFLNSVEERVEHCCPECEKVVFSFIIN